MAVQLEISPRIIPSIASLYNDVNRIFMEYIDNSLDGAEEFYIPAENKYSRPIKIILEIKGSSYKDGVVIITDNCTGISNLPKVVQSIGDSDKKAQPWTNGQFGYGIYSFMAGCELLEIKSKTKNESALYIPIDKNRFDASKQQDVSFPDPKVISFDMPAGVKIFLTKFEKHNWRQINISELKTEIESHFEMLLRRRNLQIQFIDNNRRTVNCKPFDYSLIDGDIYKESVNKLSTFKGRKIKQSFDYDLTQKPIRIFLKLTKGKVLNKYPIFIIKGRKIGEIKDIKSFRSAHKSDIWGHPNLIGYIDLGDFLDPTISRNEFKNTLKSKAVFEKLMELEPVILEFIKDINKSSEEKHYKALEDFLNSALSKLAKIDSMNFRTALLSGSNIPLEGGGKGQGLSENESGGRDRSDSGIQGTNGGDFGENEGTGSGVGDKDGDIPGDQLGEEASTKEKDNPFEDSEFKGDEKRKSGFNISISHREPPQDISGKQLRSNLIGGTIEIYKNHPDFESRVNKTRKGGQSISQRLITYLAGEITIHYKDRFHMKAGQPEYGKYLFDDLVSFIYQFEDMLTPLDGKNLADIHE